MQRFSAFCVVNFSKALYLTLNTEWSMLISQCFWICKRCVPLLNTFYIISINMVKFIDWSGVSFFMFSLIDFFAHIKENNFII